MIDGNTNRRHTEGVRFGPDIRWSFRDEEVSDPGNYILARQAINLI
jgi:hypothetical protein